MIGKTISHYKILEKLGEGSMGKVYLAEDTKLKRKVALKFLPKEFSRDLKSKERFINEARIASTLDHNNVCGIYEIDETENGQLFISMNYYKGETLQEKLKKDKLSLDKTLNYIKQIASGLEAAHKKQIVHCDIKPGNILITEDNIAKIVDFGIAKVCCEVKLKNQNHTSGTLAYMSPEQISGAEFDNRSDIWSLGVLFYEMLTKQLPFQDSYNEALMYSIANEELKSLTSLNTEIPLGLDSIVFRALAKDPKKRYQHLNKLIADLNLFQNDQQKVITTVQAPTTPIIAVLPFTNISADKNQDYFCDGIAEDILNDLTHLKGLRVVARSSSFAFKNKNQDIHRIGLKLGADTLVEGSVRKMGNRLRITAQLINVSDATHLWSERYDRELEDVFSIQEEIASSIVDALEIKLSTREKSVLEKVKTRDIHAYDYYLKGREFFHKVTKKNIKYASDMFTRAIEKDPNYALAYAGLADCYSYLFTYFDSRKEILERSTSASKKALELDHSLAEAHSARGFAAALNLQYTEAEKEFDKAIELNQKLYEPYYFYARACRQQGKFKKAARLFRKAIEVRPDDYQAQLFLADAYKDLNLSDKAKEAHQRAILLSENHIQLNPDDARALYLGAGALVKLGESDKAIEWCERAIEIDPNDPSVLYNVSCSYSLLGKIDQALDYFEKSIDFGLTAKDWIETDSDLDPIRNKSRFKKIMSKIL